MLLSRLRLQTLLRHAATRIIIRKVWGLPQLLHTFQNFENYPVAAQATWNSLKVKGWRENSRCFARKRGARRLA